MSESRPNVKFPGNTILHLQWDENYLFCQLEPESRVIYQNKSLKTSKFDLIFSKNAIFTSEWMKMTCFH